MQLPQSCPLSLVEKGLDPEVPEVISFRRLRALDSSEASRTT